MINNLTFRIIFYIVALHTDFHTVTKRSKSEMRNMPDRHLNGTKLPFGLRLI